MTQWYKEDLAYIHHTGFKDYALKSAPEILKIFTENKISQGLIVDLGCGTGLSAKVFTDANYPVLGVDISESAIAIARNRVPQAQFQIESLFKVEIPPCSAVTSIGECLNYLFDPDGDRAALVSLFHRIYTALIPGGLFIFDIAEPGQVTCETPTKHFTEGDDWIVLVEKEENQTDNLLTRRIITFRKQGESYRRDDEIHHLQLYHATDLQKELNRIGFEVKISQSYGQFPLPKAHAALLARKPI